MQTMYSNGWKPCRPPFSRRITTDHARVIASTGGVVGIWPPVGEFPTLNALATGMARMVDVIGIDHVALGSDMRGLVGASILPNFDRLPGFAQALLEAGFSYSDVGKLLGENCLRVLPTTMV